MSDFNDNITVLIIDDNSVYCSAIAVAAIAKNIVIKIATNLEDGLGMLKDDKKIEFVILDGKCFINSDQEKSGQTVSNMPIRALEKIKEINQDQNRGIGYCVNTGFVDDLGESFEGVFTVFDKDEELETLFNFIKKTVANSDKNKLKRIYKDAFVPFDKSILPIRKEDLLINLVNRLETRNDEQEGFTVGRLILEEIYKTLILNYDCIPKVCLKSREEVNLTYCTIFMGGRGPKYILEVDEKQYPNGFVIPQHISWTFGYLNSNLNLLAHPYNQEYNKYAFISAANGVLEILSWLPKFIEENFE